MSRCDTQNRVVELFRVAKETREGWKHGVGIKAAATVGSRNCVLRRCLHLEVRDVSLVSLCGRRNGGNALEVTKARR